MTEMPADKTADVTAVADSLGFPVSDETLERCLEKIAELETATPSPPELPVDSIGHAADDPHNALLDVYDQPRSRSTSGPLSGMMLAIKDNIIVKDLRLTCGFESFAYVPDTDAVVVDRLLDAGASILGKANMDALAIGPGGGWSELGQVNNPAYPDLYPGGSSSGSAAAIAADRVDAAFGSDTGGSVRKPATYCGLVGIKPTHGLVPLHGIVPLAPSLDTIGPIAKTVQDAARLLEVISGYHPADPSSSRVTPPSMTAELTSPGSLTIGIPDTFLECAIDEVREEIKAAIDTLTRESDFEAREVSLDNEPFSEVWPHIATGDLIAAIRNHSVQYGQGTWYDDQWHTALDALVDRGFNEHITYRELPWAYINTKTNGLSYIAARKRAIDLEQTVSALFTDVDVLLTPAVPRLPPTLDTDLDESPHRRSINFKPFNLTGHPAVVVPTGEVEGRPVSAQIIAPHFADHRALQVAHSIETLAH